jgi:plastocyanin
MERPRFRIIALLGLLLALPVSAFCIPVSGRVRLTGRPPGVSIVTIVYAEPLDGGRVQPGQFSMAQRNKAFLPHVLAVPAGSTINFPNEDQIFHNVFTLSRPSPFDLGLYRAGASKAQTFTAPATYRVFCNIHPQMTAIILVVPTSFIAEVDGAGNYRLDLPAGRYRVTAWSERADASSVDLTVTPSGQPVPELLLDETKFVELQHKNKFGQDYPKSAYDPKKN